MALPDLQGPVTDFYARTAEIRRVVVGLESVHRGTVALNTARPNIDLAGIGVQTQNTVNAMSLVFLASSFEEFVREEIGQCAEYLTERYNALADETRHSIRSLYWAALVEKLRFVRSILTRTKPHMPDAAVVGDLRRLLDSAKGFVVDDDPALIEREVLAKHSNNYKPRVVDELGSRIGVKSLIRDCGDSSRLKAYFAVATKGEAADLLKPRLDEFYERRNTIVHSLTGSTGFATDVVLDYLELFEMTADAIRATLTRAVAKW